MKKTIGLLLVMLMVGLMAIPVMAAPEEPVITMQPQSPNYPEYSVAIYTVKATGTNLSATWYIEWNGKTYNASQIGGAMQPWEAYAGESYGARKVDDNTFSFVFEGIEEELSGAKIWCVIEDGHYDVTSQTAHITVGNYGSPPEILDIPAQMTVEVGEDAELRCIARSTDQSQLYFLWYETATGNLEDIQAIRRGAETGDFMFCDTSREGTFYYVCGITTTGGGMAYSSVVQVNVVKRSTTAAAPTTPITPPTATTSTKIETEVLPGATAGKYYLAQIRCNDPTAEFSLSYNPGQENDFEKTGLTLSRDGFISGTPQQPGSYTFCVCAAGASGEDYYVYTLMVAESTLQEETEPIENPQATEPDMTETIGENTPAPNEKQESERISDGIPWWGLVLVSIGAAGVGVGVAVILIKIK